MTRGFLAGVSEGVRAANYKFVDYAAHKGLAGVVVDLAGAVDPATKGNIRIKRCAGDICIDVHDGTAWRPAHSFTEEA